MKYAFIASVFFIIQAIESHEYTLTVAAIFKDEAPYLKEWIEYHKIVGAQHFRLYNNDSHDDYLTVLAPYIQKGEVSLIEFPSSKAALLSWVYLTQWPSCVDAINYYNGKSKWLALIDIDEFLLPLEAPNMVSFLKDYENYPGVILNWQCFGTSFVEDIPPGQLMIETLTLKAEEFSTRNLPVKSIVRPEYVDVSRINWAPHTCHYLTDTPAVFPNNKPRPEDLEKVPLKCWICPEKAVINHYVHRTEQYFRTVKIQKKVRMERGEVTKEYIESWHEDCNQVEDKRIFRFLPDLQQKMFQRE